MFFSKFIWSVLESTSSLVHSSWKTIKWRQSLPYVLIKSNVWLGVDGLHPNDGITSMIILLLSSSQLPRCTFLFPSSHHEFWSALTPNYIEKWLICELTFKMCAKLRNWENILRYQKWIDLSILAVWHDASEDGGSRQGATWSITCVCKHCQCN